jgi:Putative prokaryotic signal transducing protein
MAELIRTNDLALIAVVEALLQGEGIPVHVADRHTSGLEGGMNWLQMRILVPDEAEAGARELITEAELGEWLRT